MMRFLGRKSKLQRSEGGFTLTEVVIILPIATFITVTLFAFMIDQYGSMLAASGRANLLLEAQTMLLNIEDELLFTTGYGSTLRSDLTDTHQPFGGWDFNTSPDTLIINETALTAPRREPDREFIYEEVYTCGTSNAVYNPIAFNNLIYFTEPNSSGTNNLYRRTVIPTYSTCGENYKVGSCPESAVGTGGCTKEDDLLSEKVVDFVIEYFDVDDNPIDHDTGDPGEGEKLEVTLVLGDRVYGNDIQVTTSLTLKKIN